MVIAATPVRATIKAPAGNSQGGTLMWPFSPMSLVTANRVSDIANLGLVASLVAGVLATFFIVKASNVKESYWEIERDASRERMALLEASAELAKRDIAIAQQKAAEANLKLAEITSPRHLGESQAATIKQRLENGPKGKVVVKGRWPDEEAMSFARQIAGILTSAGFEVIETEQSKKVLSLGNVGVNLIVHNVNEAPQMAISVFDAFAAVGVQVPGINRPEEVPDNEVFWIMVGSRY